MIGAPPTPSAEVLLLVVQGSGILPLFYLAGRQHSARPFFPPRSQPFGPLDPPGFVLLALSLFFVYGLFGNASRGGLGIALLGGFALIATAAAIAQPTFAKAARPIGSVRWRVGAGLLVVWASFPFVFGTYLLLQYLGLEGTQSSVELLQSRGEGWVGLAFTAGIVAPVVEEVGFRGLLYPALRQWVGPRAALVATAVLFGLIHSPAVTWAPLMILAVFLAYSVEATGSLVPAIVGHMAFNSLTLLQLL